MVRNHDLSTEADAVAAIRIPSSQAAE